MYFSYSQRAHSSRPVVHSPGKPPAHDPRFPAPWRTGAAVAGRRDRALRIEASLGARPTFGRGRIAWCAGHRRGGSRVAGPPRPPDGGIVGHRRSGLCGAARCGQRDHAGAGRLCRLDRAALFHLLSRWRGTAWAIPRLDGRNSGGGAAAGAGRQPVPFRGRLDRDQPVPPSPAAVLPGPGAGRARRPQEVPCRPGR